MNKRDKGLLTFFTMFAYTMAQQIPSIDIKEPVRPRRKRLKLRKPAYYQAARELPDLKRNEPCHCGSDLKYKHCHWRKDRGL